MKERDLIPAVILLVVVVLLVLSQINFQCEKSTAVIPPRAKQSTAIWDTACAHGDTLTTGHLIGGCYICIDRKDILNPTIDTLHVVTIQRISETAVAVHLINEDRQYEKCVKTICKGEVK